MPKLKDATVIWRRFGTIKFAKLIHAEIGGDDLFTLAAAMAYAWLFSIFPFIIILLTLLPYLPEKYRGEAQYRITNSVQTLPKETAQLITTNIDRLLNTKRGGLLSVGIIVTLWGASGGMAATMSAIDKCYDVEKSRPFYKQRPLAIFLTVIVATLIVAVLILLPVTTTAINIVVKWQPFVDWLGNHPWMNKLFGPILAALNLIRWLVALILLFTTLGVIYYFSPNVKHRFRFISPGSVFSVLVWIVLGIGFRFYIDKFGKYDQTYGTLGGVVILLLFFYIDALVLLIGAEINNEIDKILKAEPVEAMPPPGSKSEPPTPQQDSSLIQVGNGLEKTARDVTPL